MLKVACIIYHKNALSLYKQEWIDQCINSIKGQTFSDFTVFEHNYGGGEEKFANGIKPNYFFLNKEFDNHIGSLNYLHNLAFSQGFDVVFNTNLDDYYDLWRFEKQLWQIEQGAQLVSSNFYYMDAHSVVFKNMDMLAKGSIFENLRKDHNIICHPAVAMHKSFWDDDLHYNEGLVGSEDLDLWTRAFIKQKKFYICPEYLCFYRRHEKQITAVKKPVVNLLTIATQKYTKFVEPLLKSADEFFLKDCDVNYCVFSDKQDVVMWRDKAKYFYLEHKKWPYITLERFHTFKNNKPHLPEADYFFYIDVDTLFKAPISASDILSDITAVRHCGFTGKRGSYETRPESTSYVAENEGTRYYGGGFWGFSKKEFWLFVDTAVVFIDKDREKRIIPVYHDESVLNRLLINNPPTKVLSPSYHYPEGNIERYKTMWGRDYEMKILLLEKDHKEFQV